MGTTIYPDTVIWNELFDQNIDAPGLTAALLLDKSCLIMSTQVICELAATFASKRTGAQDRGSKLFSFMLEFVRLRTPCLKMNSQLFQEEASVASGQKAGLEYFLSADDYNSMKSEMEKLANGNFELSVSEFLSGRKQLAQQTRVEAAEFIRLRDELRTSCVQNDFRQFLQSVLPVDRLKIMRKRLLEEFPNTDPDTLNRVAIELLKSPSYRVANAMLRADIYVTWRTARSGSLPRDVPDDCSHLVNCAHCGIYVTKDEPQMKYAPDVLDTTEVRFYEGTIPISEWLLKIAKRS